MSLIFLFVIVKETMWTKDYIKYMFSLKKNNKMNTRGPTTQAKNWHSQYLEVSMCFSLIIPLSIPHNEDHSPEFRINYSLPFFIVLLPIKISINNIYDLVLYFLTLNLHQTVYFFLWPASLVWHYVSEILPYWCTCLSPIFTMGQYLIIGLYNLWF